MPFEREQVPTVLVVDDEAPVRRLFSRALGRQGFNVLEAGDGPSALELIAANDVDIVLLDNALPGMMGTEVLARLRASNRTATLPIILVAGHGDVIDRVRGLQAGADDYLPKPVALDELVARVRSHLRGRDAWLTQVEERLHDRARIAGALASIDGSGELVRIADDIAKVITGLQGVAAISIVEVFLDGTARYLTASRSSEPPATNPGTPVHPLAAAELLGAEGAQARVLRGDATEWFRPRPEGELVVVAVPASGQAEVMLVLEVEAGSEAHRRTRLREVLGAAMDLAPVVESLVMPAIQQRDRGEDTLAKIRTMIAEEAYHPVFQPIVDLATGDTAGYEALTRFADGVPPERRFTEAASAGLGLDLEAATLRTALLTARELPSGLPLSLNVSPGLLTSGRLADLLATGGGRSIVVELTEHERVEDYAVVIDAVATLGVGVRLAVDDTGAGWASLRHVLSLRPDFVKVDRAWVTGVDQDPARQALLLGICRFVEELGGAVIAEGIETDAELAAVRQLGVPFGQGYRLGRPVPIRQVNDG